MASVYDLCDPAYTPRYVEKPLAKRETLSLELTLSEFNALRRAVIDRNWTVKDVLVTSTAPLPLPNNLTLDYWKGEHSLLETILRKMEAA